MTKRSWPTKDGLSAPKRWQTTSIGKRSSKVKRLQSNLSILCSCLPGHHLVLLLSKFRTFPGRNLRFPSGAKSAFHSTCWWRILIKIVLDEESSDLQLVRFHVLGFSHNLFPLTMASLGEPPRAPEDLQSTTLHTSAIAQSSTSTVDTTAEVFAALPRTSTHELAVFYVSNSVCAPHQSSTCLIGLCTLVSRLFSLVI